MSTGQHLLAPLIKAAFQTNKDWDLEKKLQSEVAGYPCSAKYGGCCIAGNLNSDRTQLS